MDTTVPSFLIEIREPGDHQLPPETAMAATFDQPAFAAPTRW
ncbi:hypothetical protein [Streptomyces macrosporus]